MSAGKLDEFNVALMERQFFIHNHRIRDFLRISEFQNQISNTCTRVSGIGEWYTGSGDPSRNARPGFYR